MYKSRYGQYLSKDLLLVNSTFSFFFFLNNFFLLINFVFCFHCLTPLELELFELTNIFSSLFLNLQPFIFLLTLNIFFFLFLNLLLQANLN
jgi:hypothetical protein